MKRRVVFAILAVIAAATVLFGIMHLVRTLAADYERGEIVGVSRLEGTTTGQGRFIRRADGATLLCRRVPHDVTANQASGRDVRVVADEYEAIEARQGQPPSGGTVRVWTPEGKEPGETIIASVPADDLLEVEWGVLSQGALTGRVGDVLLIEGDAALGSPRGGFLASSILPGFILIPALLGFPYGYLLSRERGVRSKATGNLTMSLGAIGYAFVGPALNLAIWSIWVMVSGDGRFASHPSLASVMLPMLLVMIAHAGLMCYGSVRRVIGTR